MNNTGATTMNATNAAMEQQPTADQFGAYRAMFQHFNRELFDGQLPEPLLNFSRGPQSTVAFFAFERWLNSTSQARTHEISLNPRHLADGSACDTAQSLVHEMVHQWQYTYGTPGRKGYHNREWSEKMVAVGLQPIDAKTGKPAMSAHSMSDAVISGGEFERAFTALPAAALLPWSCVEAQRAPATPAPAPTGGEGGEAEGDEPAQPKPRNKSKYTCPVCNANVWGKPGMSLACFSGGHEPAIFQMVG
jgi:predicted SprT family Zn-dependent metalloprotease